MNGALTSHPTGFPSRRFARLKEEEKENEKKKFFELIIDLSYQHAISLLTLYPLTWIEGFLTRIKIENFLQTNLDLTHLSEITLIIPPVCTAQWHDWTSSEFRTRASGEEVRRWVISQPKIPRPLERRENENDKRLSCHYRRGAPRESRGGVRVESGVRVRLGARDEGRIRDV